MKKYFLAVAIILSSSLGFAQQNTISVSYGAGSTNQVFATMFNIGKTIGESVIDGVAGRDRKRAESNTFVGPITLSYHRTLESNQRFSLGASVAYDNAIYNYKTDTEDSYKNTFSDLTIAPEAKFKYLNPGGKFNLYGLIGAGISFGAFSTDKKGSENQNDSYTHFNFQITPLGVEFGESIKGFAEFGIWI